MLAKIVLSTLEKWCYRGNGGCPMGIVCIQNESLYVYGQVTKFQLPLLTVSAQHREDPACGRIPLSPRSACFGLTFDPKQVGF